MRVPPYDPHLPRVLCPNTITLSIRISAYESGGQGVEGETNIPTITIISSCRINYTKQDIICNLPSSVLGTKWRLIDVNFLPPSLTYLLAL